MPVSLPDHLSHGKLKAEDNNMNNLKYIFVHGLSGWGSYDEQYQKMPYWGMKDGDLMVRLRKEGFDCYAASVHPSRSAYDRACELFAQLTGRITDYGKVHSERNGHEQYGPNFRNRPLIDKFDKDTRLVLIGHSFGGATIRTFAHLMAHGSPEETYVDNPLFRGGMADNIFAIVTVAAPHNGTTAYDMYEDPSFDPKSIKIPLDEKIFNRFMNLNNSRNVPAIAREDLASYDMHIDNAMKLNEKLKVLENVYYFSQPCCSTENVNGLQVPIRNETEILYRRSSRIMGAYKGRTAGGMEIDETWRPNDGLVNTLSAAYPLGQPHKAFDPDNIEKGTWNVFETVKGDHMALQGGFFRKRNIYSYYLDLLKLIERL